MSGFREQALTFRCGEARLVGVLSRPATLQATRGVLIVVGGPQYRAGSHRQFTLLARHLAARGVPALRFDYRGMGDSEGAPRGFETVAEDIASALDAFFAALPEMKDVVIWGLCDAASAALDYAHRDPRVSGIVLANPWVRTQAGIARAHIRHYYARRLLQGDFWRKLARGALDLRASARSLARFARDAAAGASPPASLPERMLDGLRRFRGRVLVILSGDDLTASEFRDLVAASPEWRSALDAHGAAWFEIPEANHTFARRDWRDRVAARTGEWVEGA